MSDSDNFEDQIINKQCGCGYIGIRIEWRLEAKPIGSFSLAGQQDKVSAYRHPYAVCLGCGTESRGKMAND